MIDSGADVALVSLTQTELDEVVTYVEKRLFTQRSSPMLMNELADKTPPGIRGDSNRKAIPKD